MNIATRFAAGLFGAMDKQKLDRLHRGGALVTPQDFDQRVGSSTQGAAPDATVALTKMFESGLPWLIDQYYTSGSAIVANAPAAQVGVFGQGFGARSGIILNSGGRITLGGMDHDTSASGGWQADQFAINDLSIFVNSYSSNVPLSLKAADGDTGSHSPGVSLRNINIVPTSTSNGCSNAHLALHNLRQGKISGFNIKGKVNAYQGVGIAFYPGPGSAPVAVNVDAGAIAHVATGVFLDAASGAIANDDAQGHHFKDFEILACDRGIHLKGGPEGFGEWATIMSVHSYCREIAIYSENYGNLHVSHCDMLGHGALPTIQALGVIGSSIMSRVFVDHYNMRFGTATGATKIGINIPSGWDGSVAHCRHSLAADGLSVAAYSNIPGTVSQTNNL